MVEHPEAAARAAEADRRLRNLRLEIASIPSGKFISPLRNYR